MLALTEPALEKLKIGWVKLTGSVPSAKRGALVEQFFQDPTARYSFRPTRAAWA